MYSISFYNLSFFLFTVPRPVQKSFPTNHQGPIMPTQPFYGGHPVNHTSDPTGYNPNSGPVTFGSHNLHSTQTAVLGSHNLYSGNTSPHSNTHTNFNFNVTKSVHHHSMKNLENVMENLEVNNLHSPTRKTSHNFTKPNSSDCERQKSVSGVIRNEKAPILLAENIGIPYQEETSQRLSIHRDVKPSKLPTEHEVNSAVNTLDSTPEVPPKVYLSKKSPVFARGSSDNLFHFDPQRIQKINNTSQEGNS